MSETVGISFEIDKTLCDNFAAICSQQGYSTNVVYRQLIEQYVKSSPPISKNIPNEETLAGMEEIAKGQGITAYHSTEDMFKDLDI